MGLQVWLPLNKDNNVIPGISSFSKEGSVTFTEDTDGWYKVVDSSHTSSRWGIYYDFDVRPSTTYTLTVYSKSTTGISCSIGIGSFPGAVTWPAVRDTNNTSTEKLTTYTWTTTQNDTRARIYLAMTPGSTIADNYVFYKEPKVCEALTNQGLSNVTVTNNGATVDNNGKIGKCYYFNGTSTSSGNTIYIPQLTIPNTFSVSGWFKLVASVGNGSAEYLVCLNNNAYSGDMQFAIAHRSKGLFVIVNNTEYTIQSLELDIWYHIALTFNGTYAKVYINGTEVNSRTVTSTAYTGHNFNIGSRSSAADGSTHSYYSKIYVSGVRLYDNALSASEVKLLSQGLVLHYPLDRNGWGQENLATCTTPVYNIAASASSNYNYIWINNNTLEPNTTYTFSAEVTVSDSDKCTVYNYTASGKSGSINYNFPADGKRHSWTFTTTADAIGFIAYAGTAGSTAGHSAVYKNIKVEKGDKVTPYIPRADESLYTTMGISNVIEYDVSGYQNNGTRTGTSTWISNSPKYNLSQYFTGSSNYIRTASGTFNWFSFDKCTVSIWMKPTSTPSSYTGSFGIGHNSSDGYYSKCFSICNSSGKFTVNAAKGSTWIFVTSSYVCPLNEWHHYVATLDGTSLKMYVDGQQIHTATIDWGTAYVASDTCVQVAVDLPGSDEMYQGYYSDARIYTTALSADDILELYNNKVI